LYGTPLADPLQIAADNDLLQESNASALEPVIEEVLRNFAGKVEEYRKGKKGLLSLFVGEVMKRTKGRADPKLTNELLIKKIKE
jgi:aspartyl-tRNA(Asn)/glutamyl-tRNA(Gln) amidotransferase subunit B